MSLSQLLWKLGCCLDVATGSPRAKAKLVDAHPSSGACVANPRVALDRRQHERIRLAVPVFVRGTDAQGKGFLEFVTMLNISVAGALLVGPRYLPRSSTVMLEVPSAPPTRLELVPKAVRRMRGRILRTEARDGYYLCALKFLSRLPNDAT